MSDSKGKPVSKGKAHSYLNKKGEIITYDLSAITILLVEDSRSMQALVASMLRSLGVGQVMVCDGGNEAMDLLTITQARKKGTDINIKGVDVVMTDWLMPDGSGLELIDWIRAHSNDAIRFLPVILLSAYTTHEVVAAARDHGANEALVKPVSGEGLASRLLSVIERPRPYVKTPTYFGPDRRRQQLPYEGAEKRHIKIEEVEAEIDHEWH